MKKLKQQKLEHVVSTRLFEPFSTNKLLVFTRIYAMNPDGSYNPFSTRLRGKYGNSLVTVLGVVMPLRTDLEGEPILRTMPVERYSNLKETEELRTKLFGRIGKAELYELIRIDEALTELAL